MDIPQNRRQIAGGRRGIFVMAALGFALCLPSRMFAGDPAPRLAGAEATGLNLTPPQQQKLTALETVSRAQSQQLIDQIQKLRHALSDAYEAYNVDVSGVRKTNLELNRVQGQLLDLRLSQQLQLRKILTPDQFAQLQAAMHKHEAFEGGRQPEPDGRQRHHHWDAH